MNVYNKKAKEGSSFHSLPFSRESVHIEKGNVAMCRLLRQNQKTAFSSESGSLADCGGGEQEAKSSL